MNEAAKPLDAAGDEKPFTLKLDKDGRPVLLPGTPVMKAFPVNGIMHVTARRQTVAELVRLLERQIGRPVADRTGLAGTYDFDLSYAVNTVTGVVAGSAASAEPSGQGGVLGATPLRRFSTRSRARSG